MWGSLDTPHEEAQSAVHCNLWQCGVTWDMSKKEPTFEVRVEAGDSTKGRVPVRRVTEKLSSIESALSQCAEVVFTSKPKKTGRRKAVTKQLTELYFADLRFDSFGATISIGTHGDGLFSSIEASEVTDLFSSVLSDLLGGNTFETLMMKLKLSQQTASKVLEPFVQLLPSKEDDTTLEISVKKRKHVISARSIEPIVDLIPKITKRSIASPAVVLATVKWDKDGNPIGIAQRDTVEILADSKSEDTGSLRIKSYKTMRSAECEITFANSLIVVVQEQEEGLFRAHEATFGFSSIADTESESLEMLEEFITSTYYLLAQSSSRELTGEAQQLKRRFNQHIIEVREDG